MINDATVAARKDGMLSTVASSTLGTDTAAKRGTGVVALEHYQLVQELAHGGMGRIWIANDRRLGRTVALKQVLIPHGPLADRFEREARITGRLQHPSIVSVYEAGKSPSGEPFYAMPLIKGKSLDAAIAERSSLDKPIEERPRRARIALGGTCRTLGSSRGWRLRQRCQPAPHGCFSDLIDM